MVAAAWFSALAILLRNQRRVCDPMRFDSGVAQTDTDKTAAFLLRTLWASGERRSNIRDRAARDWRILPESERGASEDVYRLPILRRTARLCGRALRLHCPHCGQPHIRRDWFHFVQRCPRCGLRLERGESDHWLGGYLINFIVAELLIVTFMLIAILATWPAVPWKVIVYGALVPAVAGPFVTYPFARNLWLAIDLLLRPPESEDFR